MPLNAIKQWALARAKGDEKTTARVSLTTYADVP